MPATGMGSRVHQPTEERMSNASRAVVGNIGDVGVFIPAMHDRDGTSIARLLLSIERIRALESLSTMTGPKFDEAMRDPAIRCEVKDAIKSFCGRVRSVGIVEIKTT